METVTQLFPHINPDVTLIIPQLIVLGTALLLLLGDVLLDRSRHSVLTWLTLVGFGAALVANFFYIGVNRTTFNGMFRADDISVFVNLIALTGAILSVMISASYLEKNVESGGMPLPEYYVLL
ncbi:MAG TPA: NADH-quinone oxidoreductase subunit N, partial [Chloroflexi bacterium]|nr:NADH-quinone oxidoreductase subunit N [Chloroflexota bacterium]